MLARLERMLGSLLSPPEEELRLVLGPGASGELPELRVEARRWRLDRARMQREPARFRARVRGEGSGQGWTVAVPEGATLRELEDEEGRRPRIGQDAHVERVGGEARVWLRRPVEELYALLEGALAEGQAERAPFAAELFLRARATTSGQADQILERAQTRLLLSLPAERALIVDGGLISTDLPDEGATLRLLDVVAALSGGRRAAVSFGGLEAELRLRLSGELEIWAARGEAEQPGRIREIGAELRAGLVLDEAPLKGRARSREAEEPAPAEPTPAEPTPSEPTPAEPTGPDPLLVEREARRTLILGLLDEIRGVAATVDALLGDGRGELAAAVASQGALSTRAQEIEKICASALAISGSEEALAAARGASAGAEELAGLFGAAVLPASEGVSALEEAARGLRACLDEADAALTELDTARAERARANAEAPLQSAEAARTAVGRALTTLSELGARADQLEVEATAAQALSASTRRARARPMDRWALSQLYNVGSTTETAIKAKIPDIGTLRDLSQTAFDEAIAGLSTSVKTTLSSRRRELVALAAVGPDLALPATLDAVALKSLADQSRAGALSEAPEGPCVSVSAWYDLLIGPTSQGPVKASWLQSASVTLASTHWPRS